MNRGLEKVRQTALSKKYIKNADEIKESTRKNKRFMIKHNDKWIHFGQWPFSGHGTYIDHQNKEIKKAWRARHSKILKNGKPAYKNRDSADFYSWHLLW
jgi:hypothetical protein